MASFSNSLFISLFLLSLLSLSTSLPYETILDASEILSDSGYVSMALTLEVVSETLLAQSPSLTIFAPSDSAFRKSGQPSLDLLRYHLIPLPLPLESLRLLPAGTKIPTMYAAHSLTVTSSLSDGRISLNDVKVTESPIFDDGLFVIFGIDKFFDPNFQFSLTVHSPVCVAGNNTAPHSSDSDSFGLAGETLRSSGYSVMAAFLGMQLSGFNDQKTVTILAPSDEVMLTRVENFSDYPSLFLRHVVPCKILWNDLVNLEDGTELPTFLNGSTVRIARSGGVLLLNEVPVFFPDMYHNDVFVVHGLREVLVTPEKPQEIVPQPPLPLIDGKGGEENVFFPGFV